MTTPPIAPAPVQSQKGHRKAQYDPVEVSTLAMDDETPAREAEIRKLALDSAKNVLSSLVGGLTEKNAARVLQQIAEASNMYREQLRLFGAYDMPEERNRRRKRPGTINIASGGYGGYGLAVSSEEAYSSDSSGDPLFPSSDAETFGATIFREGLAMAADYTRAARIQALSRALESLVGVPNSDAEQAKLREEIVSLTLAPSEPEPREVQTLPSTPTLPVTSPGGSALPPITVATLPGKAPPEAFGRSSDQVRSVEAPSEETSVG